MHCYSFGLAATTADMSQGGDLEPPTTQSNSAGIDLIDSLPTPRRDFRVGNVKVDSDLVYFVLYSIILLFVTVFSLVNLSLHPENPLWAQLLTLVVGMVVPPPRINRQEEEPQYK